MKSYSSYFNLLNKHQLIQNSPQSRRRPYLQVRPPPNHSRICKKNMLFLAPQNTCRVLSKQLMRFNYSFDTFSFGQSCLLPSNYLMRETVCIKLGGLQHLRSSIFKSRIFINLRSLILEYLDLIQAALIAAGFQHKQNINK